MRACVCVWKGEKGVKRQNERDSHLNFKNDKSERLPLAHEMSPAVIMPYCSPMCSNCLGVRQLATRRGRWRGRSGRRTAGDNSCIIGHRVLGSVAGWWWWWCGGGEGGSATKVCTGYCLASHRAVMCLPGRLGPSSGASLLIGSPMLKSLLVAGLWRWQIALMAEGRGLAGGR